MAQGVELKCGPVPIPPTDTDCAGVLREESYKLLVGKDLFLQSFAEQVRGVTQFAPGVGEKGRRFAGLGSGRGGWRERVAAAGPQGGREWAAALLGAREVGGIGGVGAGTQVAKSCSRRAGGWAAENMAVRWLRRRNAWDST